MRADINAVLRAISSRRITFSARLLVAVTRRAPLRGSWQHNRHRV